MVTSVVNHASDVTPVDGVCHVAVVEDVAINTCPLDGAVAELIYCCSC